MSEGPPEGPSPPAGPVSPPLSTRQRDFLLLNIFVQIQHGYRERAGVLAEALHHLGDRGPDVLLARAVLHFLGGRWQPTLSCLDELDRIAPTERFGFYRLTERQRMRRYLRSRCLFELNDTTRARDALESYLRHGASAEDEGDGEGH
ncbi:hypothetical protein [Aureimonas jatrophae]|uniref:Uncharacterized protein n=1 Tax=Aureimonas jatrophae TaxID=1166073 RepID=A0A1H0EST6_9HYPH|nr:hypothetical protein [Aureimonas jatrophae]MBB3950331.1 hypothetical protein [Aureimonas jatrophae]SDN85448.1 hypothetical protein SAMN05192530_102204 [Aureimonas jatrophae]